MQRASGRHVIGAMLVDLLKFLKNHERAQGAQFPLGATSRATLERRVLHSEWLPVEIFLELLQVLDVSLLKGDEQLAMEMGASGGASMRGLLKAYSVPGDPKTSVLSMRHAWRAHYDFGHLTCDATSDVTLLFTVADFPDMPMVHGLMTAGWGVAAARAAGAPDVRVTVLDRPWRGAPTLRYEILF